VEASVSGIAKDQEAEEARRLRNQNRSSASTIKSSTTRTTSSLTSNTEKPLPPRPEDLARESLDSEKAGARVSRTTDGTIEASEGSVPVVAGLFRSIQKPLASIGRIFSDDGSTPTLNSSIANRGDSLEAEHPALIPALVPTARAPRPIARDQQPAHSQQQRQRSPDDELPPPPPPRREMPMDEDRHEFGSQDAAAMQSSAESAEAYRIMQAEHGTVVE